MEGHDIGEPATDRERLERALVLNSIKEFGFAPRDVYEGIFNRKETWNSHHIAVKALTYFQLIELVKDFHVHQRLEGHSHRVVAVRPIRLSSREDVWEVRFKSRKIAKNVLRHNKEEQYNQFKGVHSLFHFAGSDSEE